MPVLAELLATDASKLVFGLHVLDADSTPLNQLLDERLPQSHVFYSRAVGPVAGDAQSRGIPGEH